MTRVRAIVLTGGILGGFLFAFAGGVAWDRHVQSRVLQDAREIIDSQAEGQDPGPAEDGRYDDNPDGDDAGMDDSDTDADDGGSCDVQDDDGSAVSI
jgi:hypothetical protein